MKKSKIITVYSTKGGSGKTFISTSLAASGVLNGKKTLLIDCNFYNSELQNYTDVFVKNTVFNLCDDIDTKCYTDIRNYVTRYNNKLDILCSPKNDMENVFIKEKHLDIIFNDARKYYDLIVVDTNSIFDDKNIEIFKLSDMVLTIINNDYNTINKTRRIFNIFKNKSIKYKTIYNTSLNVFREYYTYYDMLIMLNNNIDYTIGKEALIKDIIEYQDNHFIPLLYKDNDIRYYDFANKCMLIINDVC